MKPLNRIWTLCASTLFLAGLVPTLAHAEKKVVAIRSSNLPIYASALEGIKKCLKSAQVAFDLQDIVIADGNADAAISQAKSAAPDLVITLGTNATAAARSKMAGTPSLFCMVVDPKSNGYTTGGVSLDLRPSTQISFIAKHMPQFKKIGVLYSPSRFGAAAKELQAAAQKLGVEVVLQEAETVDQVEAGVNALSQKKADCLLMLSDPVLYTPQTAAQFILQTIRLNMALIAYSPAYVKAGALAGVYADYMDNGCLAGEMAARVLGGEKSDSMPVAAPSKFKFALNAVVADRLKVSLSASTLQEAEQVMK